MLLGNRLFLCNVAAALLCVAAIVLLASCGGSGGSGSPGGPNPAPMITSMNPYAATPGSDGFTLTVSGFGFVPSSMVQWNGSSRSTRFVSSTVVHAQISAADIASAGYGMVTVVNPLPGGGTSNVQVVTVSSLVKSITIVNQMANDIVWDPVNQVFYMTLPSTAPAHANTVSVLDPITGNITSSQAANSNPDVLAISDDSQFLYAGLDGSGSVQRYALPALSPDLSYSLGANQFGPYYALDLQVAPGTPHTTAVTLGSPVTPPAQGGIVIYDDSTPRPTSADQPPGDFDSLQWGADATALYACDRDTTPADFFTFTVNASGVVLDNDFIVLSAGGILRIHYDAATNLVYRDDGLVINPSNGLQPGTFVAPVQGAMTPDSTLNAAFFAGLTDNQLQDNQMTIATFNLTQFTSINTLVVPNVVGYALRLIRWGTDGLAFLTTSGQVFLIEGSIVSVDPSQSEEGPRTEHPRGTSWAPTSPALPREKE